jgi:hypothetical protein
VPGEVEAALAGPPRSFVLDGEVYELTGRWSPLLTHLPAAEWQVPLLYDLLHPDDADALADRLSDDADTLTLTTLRQVAARLVEAACGRKPWVAQRLLVTASQRWGLLEGVLTLRGVDLLTLVDTAPGRACNAVYAWLIEGADDKERTKLDSQLFRPPPGEDLDAVPLWSPEEEGSAFMAAMGAQPGGRPRSGQAPAR